MSYSIPHADIIIQELSNYLPPLCKVGTRTGIDIGHQVQGQDSLEEVSTLPLPSNSNSRSK